MGCSCAIIAIRDSHVRACGLTAFDDVRWFPKTVELAIVLKMERKTTKWYASCFNPVFTVRFRAMRCRNDALAGGGACVPASNRWSISPLGRPSIWKPLHAHGAYGAYAPPDTC